MSNPKMGTLYQEHALLGASFEPSLDENYQVVAAYANEGSAADAMAAGCVLCDLTGSVYQLLSGADAPALAQAAFCAKRLAVGECAFEPALGGDAGLMSIPLIVRCGDTEHVVIDLSQRGPVALAWLSFLTTAEEQGVRPFGNSSIEDATPMLCPLLLMGAKADRVLEDYLHRAPLPRPGQVASLALDSINAVVAAAPLSHAGIKAYFLFVPPTKARILWRSFLSFEEVSPHSLKAASSALLSACDWGSLCEENDRVRVTSAQLKGYGLLREDGGYVGQRALEAAQS